MKLKSRSQPDFCFRSPLGFGLIVSPVQVFRWLAKGCNIVTTLMPIQHLGNQKQTSKYNENQPDQVDLPCLHAHFPLSRSQASLRNGIRQRRHGPRCGRHCAGTSRAGCGCCAGLGQQLLFTVREGATGAAAATASLEEFAQHRLVGASLN